jgi:group I intron endonuclease
LETNEEEYCIYFVTNTVNDKMYIGMTKHPDKRWREHVKDAITLKSKRPICRAIRKYGADKFAFDIM